MPIEDFIICTYCCVAELLVETKMNDIRQRGFAPKLTDAELITMEIVGEFLEKDTDTKIWRYFKNQWHDWFPNLGSRVNFVKQSANLWVVKQQIQRRLAEKMGAIKNPIHIVDGFPMPVREFTRANQSKCFKGEASYGYCASKQEKYYGFEGYIMISADGVISNYTFAAANIDEREVLPDMTDIIQGLLIGDKGVIDAKKKEELRMQEIDLQTPLRKNMKDDRSKSFVRHLFKTRRLVETVIGQLCARFHIESIRVRDSFHLTNRFIRKILSHTFATFLNRILGNPILHFQDLVLA